MDGRIIGLWISYIIESHIWLVYTQSNSRCLIDSSSCWKRTHLDGPTICLFLRFFIRIFPCTRTQQEELTFNKPCFWQIHPQTLEKGGKGSIWINYSYLLLIVYLLLPSRSPSFVSLTQMLIRATPYSRERIIS